VRGRFGVGDSAFMAGLGVKAASGNGVAFFFAVSAFDDKCL
jgi:hypothetical protein